MIKFLLGLVWLFATVNCSAQQDTIRKYLDADLRFTTKKEFVYPAIAIRRDERWVLYSVYPDTSMMLEVSYKDKDLTIKDGPFTLYYPKKILAQKGTFKSNVPNGLWQSWYSNGKPKNELTIINNHISGVLKSWYQNGNLSGENTYGYTQPNDITNQHQSFPSYKMQSVLPDLAPEGKLEGPSTNWYENGNKESAVNYHNDTLIGECFWFRENGKPSTKEVYKDGKVVDLSCYDEEGKYTGATCSILKQPVLIHPMFSALDYIEDELHKEKHRDVDEGDVQVSFIVTKNGKVSNLVFVQSPAPSLNKIITEIFAKMPAWSPAVVHNRVIDYTVKMTIPYYRE
ncbi:MAG: toxin-antitoxin system YwqK family antitoxin [Chitinophagaceae bacterium]